ncbi:MAG: hypothetical protein ACXAAO_13285 [Candidatus Thorarchaeota archaeon]|jgi:hypothetical protein
MKRELYVALILTIVMLIFPFVQAQSINEQIYEVNNLHLPRGATYSDDIVFVANAPHMIEYAFEYTNATPTEIILYIRLTSSSGSHESRITSDYPEGDILYTPRTEFYQLSITATENVVEINLNLTISQTGTAPTPTPYTPETTTNLLLPIVGFVIAPLLVYAFGLNYYKKRLILRNPKQTSELFPNRYFIVGIMTLLWAFGAQDVVLVIDSGIIQSLILICGIWQYSSDLINPYQFGFFGDLITPLLHIAFIFAIYGTYQGLLSRKSAIMVGFSSLLWILAQIVFMMLFHVPNPNVTEPTTSLILPVPFLLIAGLFLLLIMPPPKRTDVWDESESSQGHVPKTAIS